jgi:uncharacterized protein YfdQ (DUF2303 family)
MDMQNAKNLAETLAEVLPKATVVHQPAITDVAGLQVAHIAVPKGTELKEVKLDLEPFLPNPRVTNAKATFSDPDSFLAYMARHAQPGSVVWCSFDPQTFALAFTGVVDENEKGTAGWRRHKAHFTPDMSAEWKAWQGRDGKAFSQVDFAQWLQDHEDDINSSSTLLPTSIQLMEMATNFVMNEERVFKSAVRLQSGGQRLMYVADADAGTTEAMQLFEKFGLAIPIFHGETLASPLTARLKYRNNGGKLSFTYELQRLDKVHKAAAEDLIRVIRAGLGEVPLLMGSST